MKPHPDFSRDRSGHGTKEWAEINANIQTGCSNDCLYCYARANALRFGKIKTREEWRQEKIDLAAVDRQWQHKRGVIMFPTAHDINQHNICMVVPFLSNVLYAGNKVLIVSKPDPVCIETLCKYLDEHREQILFRFTIGTTDPEVSRFWEPGAPLPMERIQALQFAHERGFQTSVSMEPMLSGIDMAVETYEMVKNFVTETIWIGKMNRLRQRIEETPKNLQAIREIENLQRDSEIKRLVSMLEDEPKVRWKDSIKEVIERRRA